MKTKNPANEWYWQSWRDGELRMAECNKKPEHLAITSIVFRTDPVTRWTIPGKDHSKWGISNKGSIVCFGDLNRGETDTIRSGGFVCIQNEFLHSLMFKIINDRVQCSYKQKEDGTKCEGTYQNIENRETCIA